MRLIRLSTNYPAYLAEFYARQPTLAFAPFEVQHAALMGDCFGWSDFWTRHLSNLGYTAWEPVANAEPQQKAWAKEHRVTWSEKRWLYDISIAQVCHFAPDVVFVNDYSTFTSEFFQELRNACPSIRFVVGWCGAPYRDGTVFEAYDLVLSNIPKLVEEFRSRGLVSQLFHHGFETAISTRVAPSHSPAVDFSFVGSLFKGNGMHNAREKLLTHLTSSTPLQIWADTHVPSQRDRQRLPFRQTVFDLTYALARVPGAQDILKQIPEARRYLSMPARPSLDAFTDERLRERCNPPVFGLAMYQRLASSLITLNTHIDLAANHASNMRLFEATGVGTCLLTEWQPDLHEYFKLDEEVVTYKSPEEAAEKVRYLLDHDSVRLGIAKAGQSRTHANYGFSRRAIALDAAIRAHI